MAPNPTGNTNKKKKQTKYNFFKGDFGTDHFRIVALCRTLFSLFSDNQNGILPLAKGGKFLCKVWDGPLIKEFSLELKEHFKKFYIVKPKSSREHSAEFYLFANGYHLV